MTLRDLDTLKSYFERGDIPSEENFADLIDSLGNSTNLYNLLSTRVGVSIDPFGVLKPITTLTASTLINATSVTVKGLPQGEIENLLWAVIGVYSPNAEVRKITGVSNKTITFSALDNVHSIDDSVLFTSDPTINPKWWGARGDGGSNDTTALQSALNVTNNAGGGKVFLPHGIYFISSPLIINTGTWLDGESRQNTIIYLMNGMNCDVIQTPNWATNWATMVATSDMAHDFKISHITIDGNKGGQTTGGCGLRLYGQSWILDDVEIHDCWSHGIWSSYDPVVTKVARANDVVLYENAGHGWWFRGPSDTKMGQIISFMNGKVDDTAHLVLNGNDTDANDGLGATMGCGLVLDRSHPTLFSWGGSMAIDSYHGFADYGHDLWIKPGGGCNAIGIEVGANMGHGVYIQHDACDIQKITAYGANRRVNGYSQVYIDSKYNHIDNIYTSSRYYHTDLALHTDGGYGLYINGDNNSIGFVKLYGAGAFNLTQSEFNGWSTAAKTTIGLVNAGSMNTIGSGEIREFNQGDSIGFKTGIGTSVIFNDWRLNISDCKTLVYNYQGGISKENRYTLSLYGVNQALFTGDGAYMTSDAWNALSVNDVPFITDHWDIIGRNTLSGFTILNPGFEIAGATPPAFGSWSEAKTDGSIVRTTTAGEFKNGVAAVKLTAGATMDARVLQAITVVPLREYHITFWARGDGTNSGRYAIYDATHAAWITALTSVGVPGATFVACRFSFTPPAGCTNVTINLRCPVLNGGWACFDDVDIPQLIIKYQTPFMARLPIDLTVSGVVTKKIHHRQLFTPDPSMIKASYYVVAGSSARYLTFLRFENITATTVDVVYQLSGTDASGTAYLNVHFG